MFARKREFIKDTVAHLRELQRQPRRKRKLALVIQENLITGITAAERRVKANKAAIAIIRRALRRPGNDKAVSQKLKRRMRRLQQSVEEQQALVSLYRDIGDSIAFIYVDRFDLKPLCNKPAPGAITGKKGSRLERTVLRRSYELGATTLLNDLTSSIRHGDLTLFLKYGIFRLIELKSGKGGNRKRAERQVEAVRAVMDYLATDVREWQGGPMIRVSMPSRPKYYLRAFNDAVRDLRSSEAGYVLRTPEPGLTYAAIGTTAAVDEMVRKAGPKGTGVAITVNDAKGAGSAYYPLPLIFDDADDLIAFYAGHFVVFAFVDFDEVASGLGMRARHGREEGWPIEFLQGEEPEAPWHPLGNHMLGRIGAELMSPRSVVRIATAPIDQSTLDRAEAEYARRAVDEAAATAT